MGTDPTVKEIIKQFTSEKVHADNDYFSVIRQLALNSRSGFMLKPEIRTKLIY